jgi:hypothetical protein
MQENYPIGPLLPEDGARFIGTVSEVDSGEWRASGVVQLEKGHEVLEQLVEPRMFPTEDNAREWLHQEAAARGFEKISLRSPTGRNAV